VDFILNSRYEKLSGNTITTIKRAFIDTIAVTVAAENQSLSLILLQVHKELSFEKTDTTFATAIKSDPFEYAFLFGVMSHILDYDDVNFTFYGHPSVTLIPIILALAKENNLTGSEMMEAYSVGFEVQARLGESMGSEQYQTGWHTTSTIGIYGAVAAASKLLSFNEKQIKHAFGIASSFASGTRKNFGTMTKPIHVGLVARNAYLISKMVASGVTGSEDIFSSPLSIDSITTHKMVDFSALKKLGKEWEIEQNGIIFKKYPCCAFTHRSIDAVLDIVNKNEIKLTDVVKMEALVHYKVPTVLIYDQPKTPTQAQFSMNYCLAAAFVDKEINLST
ncbi:MmgE/PrpD family protein, partial [Corynebacterium sp. TAE3-ERU30]|uniref:MmgE/PrpD family protein n=1 Tax=Corynebacterium sp. TAE3-ERU30 TaxID=2849496 RepID=UPI001C456683